MSTQQLPGSADASRSEDVLVPDVGAFLRRANSWMVALAAVAFVLIVIGIAGGITFLTAGSVFGIDRFQVLLIAIAPGSTILGVLGLLTWLAIGAATSLSRRR